MKTILIADDEENLRILIETTLEDPGLILLHCRDGAIAVGIARSQHPDLLILDWMMPGMSGLEVLRTLRGDQTTAHIPVILLTARGQEKDRAEGIAAGAYAYLVKPFSPLELLRVVQQVLSPERKTGTR